MSTWLRSSIVAFATVIAFGPSASAEVPLLDGFGGAAGYGSDCLGPSDDRTSPAAIDLTPIFPDGLQFFDRTHTTMYVNTNGNISFGEGLATYTPDAFPIANQPMIAPYWADVDIRSGGDCSMYPDGDGRPDSADPAPACHDPARNGVWWHLDVPGRRVIVTWDRVGYYRCNTDKEMSFQLVLTAVDSMSCGGGGDFDVEFRYETCEWNTGDASGGQDGFPAPDTECIRGVVGPWVCPLGGNVGCENRGGTRYCNSIPAQAGFDAGNTTDFVEIMGSRTDTIHTVLCTDSNVGNAGLWQFQIRSGVVECPDAGAACSTGMEGVCADGRMQCVGTGVECRPEVGPSPERCDNLDNDCNGMVDEGDLCGDFQMCADGVCIDVCFEGSCPEGETCLASGFCGDAACADVTCAEGERCEGGSCIGACDGIVCPNPQVCRAGTCVDLCEGATCDECTVCEGGDCVPSCEYEACAGGETCLPDGRCVADACADVSCDPGFYCDGGSCVDACAGATCPSGQTCIAGDCVPENLPDGGVPPRPDFGTSDRDAGAATTDGGGSASDGSTEPPTDGGGDDGCGCRVPSGSRSGTPWALALLPLALLLRRRRR